jgi:hypothetical protein
MFILEESSGKMMLTFENVISFESVRRVDKYPFSLKIKFGEYHVDSRLLSM